MFLEIHTVILAAFYLFYSFSHFERAFCLKTVKILSLPLGVYVFSRLGDLFIEVFVNRSHISNFVSSISLCVGLIIVLAENAIFVAAGVYGFYQIVKLGSEIEKRWLKIFYVSANSVYLVIVCFFIERFCKHIFLHRI